MKRTGILAILSLMIAGCVVVPERFSDAPIDKNAPVYISFQPSSISAGWGEYLDALVKNAALDPQKDNSKNIKSFLHTKLLLHHSGINGISDFKASSTPTADGRFDNRAAFLTADSQTDKVKLFGENLNLYSALAELPADCSDAIACSLDLESAWNSFKDSPLDLQKQIIFYTRIILKTTPEEMAKSHNGIWIFGTVRTGYQSKMFVSFPDSGKKLYDRFLCMADMRKKDYIRISFAKFSFFITHANDRTAIFESEQHINNHLSSTAKLGDDPEFVSLLENAVKPSVFLSWTAKGNQRNISCLGIITPVKSYELPEYFVCRRTAYGFYGQGLERNNWATEILRDNLLALRNWMPSENATAATTSGNTKKQKSVQPSEGCSRNMQKLSLALKEYAAANKGVYPAGLHIDGLNKLQTTPAWNNSFLCCPDSGHEPAEPGKPVMAENTGYIYFGNWKKGASPKLPLIIDMPDNHNGFFHAVLNDGSIRKFIFKDQMSIKRMASYLHTVFKYNEQDFSELIHRAEELDNLLDKESK